MSSQERTTRVAALVGICVCVFALSVLAQDCPELVARWPTSISAVAVSGDHVFLGDNSGFLAADVSDPQAPRLVGYIDTIWEVNGVAVEGGYAYVAVHISGLRVIDVSTPSAPAEVGFVDTPGSASGVAVAGGYAYVADGGSGLRVIDVSTPSAPFEVGFVDTPGSRGVAVSGDYAYVAVGGSGLRVIDVSTPSTPVEVGFVDTGYANGVAISGGYAYVANHGSGLRIINVGMPSAPFEVGFVDTPGWAYFVAVSGGYAYVADHNSGLRVIDVSTPSAPAEVGFVDTPDFAYGVAVAGGYAHVADFRSGLRVIDVSTPSTPVEVGSMFALSDTHELAIDGSYGYAAVSSSGLRVIDVSTPSTPAEVGFVDTPGDAQGVSVSGGYAFVADGGSGLRAIDVSTPSAPVEVGFADTPGYAWGVSVSGGYAFVADLGSGLRVIDVSTPSAPVEVGFVDMPGLANSVAVLGGYAYVTNGIGLRVIDVNVPPAPVEVGFVDTPGHDNAVAISGGYAYVANSDSGLLVIDVSEPSAPVEVGFFDQAGGVFAVAVSGDYAYLSAGDPGFFSFLVIDVSTPSTPVEVGFIDIPGWVEEVVVSNGYVFGAGDPMLVFNECSRSPSPDARECFIPAAAVAAGAEGAFFQTDLELNNTGEEEAQVNLLWLPRGEDNAEPVSSEPFALAAGHSMRLDNVLTEVFGLGPDSLGALKLVASSDSVIGMSRTYNISGGKAAGTYGQGLPAIRATEMSAGTAPQRIFFLSEDDDFRANVGCVNGTGEDLMISIGIFDDEGALLETRTMDLGPYANDQINHVLGDWEPVNGYVDVWADRDDALYYCYGSMLDNLTSDPTTVLPQVPSDDLTFIPAAALAAGLEGSFFTTDVDFNNVGSTDLTYELLWLPRGADNSDPVSSDTFSLAAGSSVRYGNVLGEVFGLEPDQVGALAIEAGGVDLLAMSRTYNIPGTKTAGTFGQALPGVHMDTMIPAGEKRRIIFLRENDEFRANLGCVNAIDAEVIVNIDLFDPDGNKLETKYMALPPMSNKQANRIFRDYAPVSGYVDVWTNTPGASIYCYGSVLDNVTSDPTTILPQ